jgi:uncharacterized membrane protein
VLPKPDPRDATMVAGLLLLGSGIGLVSVAAGLAVVGALLFLLAVVPPFIPRPGGR